MDQDLSRAVRDVFVRLYQEGLIYRGKRLVNWDPATQTALADDEVEMREVEGSFWYLRYPVVAGGAGAPAPGTVATPRQAPGPRDPASSPSPSRRARAVLHRKAPPRPGLEGRRS